MTRIGDLVAPWYAVATECDCGYVAVTLLATKTLDQTATAEAEHDGETVAWGDDWRALVKQVSSEMAERTGLPVSAMCSVLDHHVVARPSPDEFTAFMYDECDTRTRRR
jgi:hypothetical protein